MATVTGSRTDDAPPARDDARPSARWRGVVALVAGLLVTAGLAVVIGLGTPTPIGVEDNGDGYRLFCGAGLAPDTADGFASWKGGVVSEFVRAAPCADPQPSSARWLLEAAVAGHGPGWSLGLLAALYAVLFGLVIAAATAAASARGLRRAAVLAPVVAPVLAPPFARFLYSTYGEPAGLLGTVTAACGVAVVAVTRPADRGARATALALLALGGAVAATAKVGYAPVLPAALGVAAATAVGRGRLRRLAGPLVAVVTLAAVAVPLAAALQRQGEQYASVNAHDLVFTVVLPELGPGATAPLGLPPEAARYSGNGYFGGPERPDADWWRRAILDEPAATRADAVRLLLAEPSAAARAVGVGLQATTHADLVYLRSAPADPSLGSAGEGPDRGRAGAQQPFLTEVLDRTARPAWLPTAIVLVGTLGLAVAAVPAVRRRRPAAARWAAAGGLAGLTALALVVVAVLGDGYYEIFKHVWLAAYLLAVAGLALAGAVGAAAVGMGRAGAGTPAR